MGRRKLKLHELRGILGRFGVQCDTSRGKGGHVLFFKAFPDGTFSYPVPNRKDVLDCCMKGSRRKFRLLPEDGVSDDEFYGK